MKKLFEKKYGVFQDLTGQKFGRLTVRYLDHKEQTYSKTGKKAGSKSYWLCDCDCGKTKVTLASNLKKGLTVSCGCNRIFRLEKGESGLKEIFKEYSRSQRKKFGIELGLSLEEFKKLTSSKCYYCGSDPYQKIRSQSDHSEYIYNGLDRVDPNKPYSKDNVVPCCGRCNEMKNKYTQQEFVDHMKKILAHLKEI